MTRIENAWRHSRSRRRALASLAGLVAGSPLLAGAAQQDPRPLKDHRRTPGLDEMLSAFDFEPVCSPTCRSRSTTTGARRRLGVHAAPQPRGVRLGRIVPGRADRRSRVDLSTELLGMKMKYPDHRRADGGDGAAASRWRSGDVPRGDRGVEHADDRRQRPSVPIQRRAGAPTGRCGRSSIRSQNLDDEPRAARAVAGAGCPRHGRHRRSAGVVLRAHRTIAISAARRGRPGAAARRRAQPRRPRGPAQYRARPGPAAGTRGSISTRSGRSIKVPMIVKGILTAEDARSASSTASTASSCPITAAARWTTGRRRSRCCRRSSTP